MLRLGTRGSALALRQARRVAEQLRLADPGVHIDEHPVRTSGDVDTTSPLPDIGGRGVFAAELERALLAGTIDIAVHSLKDLPIEDTAGLCIGAVLLREDARDVLITRAGSDLASLHTGAIVGTSSARREAQLRAARDDLDVRFIRGNVDTRIAKVDAGDYAAIVLAAAGVHRLGLHTRIAQYLPIDDFVPAPGQGALAVQCRLDAGGLRTLLATIDDAEARACTAAERAFLAGLGGGCSLPIGAFADAEAGVLRLRGFVGRQDGGRAIRCELAGAIESARELGHALAQQALRDGARELLP